MFWTGNMTNGKVTNLCNRQAAYISFSDPRDCLCPACPALSRCHLMLSEWTELLTGEPQAAAVTAFLPVPSRHTLSTADFLSQRPHLIEF